MLKCKAQRTVGNEEPHVDAGTVRPWGAIAGKNGCVLVALKMGGFQGCFPTGAAIDARGYGGGVACKGSETHAGSVFAFGNGVLPGVGAVEQDNLRLGDSETVVFDADDPVFRVVGVLPVGNENMVGTGAAGVLEQLGENGIAAGIEHAGDAVERLVVNTGADTVGKGSAGGCGCSHWVPFGSFERVLE